MRFVRRSENADKDLIKKIAADYRVEPLMAGILASRGIEDIDMFLHPKMSGMHDPMLFRNMAAAVERIRTAIEKKEKIAVYADYDADGICACAILIKALRAMGAAAHPYIPDRKKEGYGPNLGAFKSITDKGFTLIITVDCGIRSVAEVEAAKESGADVIVLDHHEAGELPDTPYIVDPKVEGETYPFKDLCGAGIALKTVQALDPGAAANYIDIACVATIGDVVSLTDENRIIASEGLRKLRTDPNEGIKALCDVSGTDIMKISSRTVGFTVVPRLNAAGRMAHAKYALELLLTKDPVRRGKIADWLCRINAERQSLQADIYEESAKKVMSEGELMPPRVISVFKEGWEPGIVGLAAAKLAERFNRPAVVFSENGGILTGSARSINGINLYEILDRARDCYIRFGGHSQAAGITLEKDMLKEASLIWERAVAEKYSDPDFERTVIYDEEARPEQLTYELSEQIEMLEPFGQGNPEPCFLIRGVTTEGVQMMGGGRHSKAHLREAPDLETVRFNTDDHLREGEICDLVGSFGINRFRGRAARQFTAEYAVYGDPIGDGTEKDRYAGGAADELVCALDDTRTRCSASRFFGSLKEDMDRSPLGTLVIINSKEGEEQFIKHRSVLKDARFPGLRDYSDDSAENAVMTGLRDGVSLRNYRNIYLCGAYACGTEGALVLDTGISGLLQRTRIPAEGMTAVLRALRTMSQAGRGYDSMDSLVSDIGKATIGLAPGQIWFALKVIRSFGLIEINKKDRIHITYNGTDDTSVYERGFWMRNLMYRKVEESYEKVFIK